MSSTELGEKVNILVCLLKGRDFVVPPGGRFLKAVVKLLDFKDTAALYSEPVPFNDSDILFDSEMMWSMSRKMFQSLCSNKIKIRVTIFDMASDDSDLKGDSLAVGHIVLDLREATRFGNKKISPNRSYSQSATWKRLLGAKVPPGRQAPSVEISLVVETAEDFARDEDPTEMDQSADIPLDEEFSVTNVNQDHSNRLSNMSNNNRLTPYLDKEKGYFIFGNRKESGAKTFYFTVFIAYAKELQSLLSENPPLNPAWLFSYDLLGIPIETNSFKDLKSPDFMAERACARILATPETLSEYFNSQPPFLIYIQSTNNSRIGFAELDLKQFLQISPKNLSRGHVAVYDGALRANRIEHLNNENRKRHLSESDVADPQIGVRFCLGPEPEHGVITKQEERGMLDRNRDPREVSNIESLRVVMSSLRHFDQTDGNASPAGSRMTESLPRRQSQGDDCESRETEPQVAKPVESTPSSPKKLKLTDYSENKSCASNVDQNKEQKSRTQDSKELVKQFKFTIDLKMVQFFVATSVNCIIMYKYSVLCKNNITTDPIVLSSDGVPQKVVIPKGFCEISFRGSESNAKRKLSKHKLKFKFFSCEDGQVGELIGHAILDLSPLFATPLASDFSGNSIRESRVTIPICAPTEDGEEITGELCACFILTDCGYATEDISQTEDSFGPLQQPEPCATQPEVIPSRPETRGSIPRACAKKPEVTSSRTETHGSFDDHASFRLETCHSYPEERHFQLQKHALELEEWKKAQKELFKKQLQQLEEQHLATLSKEWETREKAREAQVIEMRTELEACLLVVKEQTSKIKTREAAVALREDKLAEREERLKKMETDRNRTSNIKAQTKERELEKALASLKAEMTSIKCEVTTLKQEAVSLKREKETQKKSHAILTVELNKLRAESAQTRQELETANKSKEGFKLAWDNAEKELKALRSEKDVNLRNELMLTKAKEEEYRIQLLQTNKDYADKVSRFAFMTNIAGSSEQAQAGPSSSSAGQSIIKDDLSSDLPRLLQQREMYLRSGVYKSTDKLIEIVDQKIAEAKQKLKNNRK